MNNCTLFLQIGSGMDVIVDSLVWAGFHPLVMYVSPKNLLLSSCIGAYHNSSVHYNFWLFQVGLQGLCYDPYDLFLPNNHYINGYNNDVLNVAEALI